MNTDALDPRLAPAFRGRAPHEIFLAVALCAVLSKMGQLEEVLDKVGDKSVDWSEIVAGRPLLDYNGKDAVTLLRDGDSVETVQAVREAYKARGIEFHDGDPRHLNPGTLASIRDQLVELGIIHAKTKAEKPKGDEKPNKGGDLELDEDPVFAGRPLSAYAGKSDDELLKMEGVTKPMIAKIRAAQTPKP